MKKALLTATVQSHIAQFHTPLIEILREKGYEIHVAARDNLREKNGLEIHNIDRKYGLSFERSPLKLNNIKVFFRLRKIIKQEQYDIISCNTPVGGIVTRLAAVGVKKKGSKVYYTAHGFHFYKGAPKKNWLIFYPIEKIFSYMTDKLITITHEDYTIASKKFHCEVEHIHGVGVNEKRYYPVSKEEQVILREKFGFTPEQKIILCVGELLPNKNQFMAIHMMQHVVKRFSDAQLLLAGNGPEKDKLEHEIECCQLKNNVKMLGYCTCLEKYQRIADVLVACSKREGLPLNLVEAMLTGNPVVATENRGHRELIQEGKTGYLVDIDDVVEMSKRVVELLSDEKLADKIGTEARTYAKAYGFSNVKSELGEIYFQ